MRTELRPIKKRIQLYNMLQQVTFERVANSAFWIPDSRFQTFNKPYKNMADSNFTFYRLLPLLRWVKTIATGKTVIESMLSLGMDNFRVAFTRFLAFYSDNPDFAMAKCRRNGQVRHVSPLTPQPKLNGRQNF